MTEKIILDDDTAESLVRALQPAVYVKGGDYSTGSGKVLPEAPAVEQYGGRVVILPLEEGRSTTGIIETVIARYCPAQG